MKYIYNENLNPQSKKIERIRLNERKIFSVLRFIELILYKGPAYQKQFTDYRQFNHTANKTVNRNRKLLLKFM